MPKAEGVFIGSDYDRWFRRRVVQYAAADPVGFLSNNFKKTVLFLNSRELPRNEDPYLMREYSKVLAATMWRAGPFGFPFGIVAPFALVGLVSIFASGDRRKRFFAWSVVLGALSIIAFFISSRHRLPAYALLCPLAVVGGESALRKLRGGHLLSPSVIGVVSLLVLCNVPLRAPTDGVNFRAELELQVGAAAFEAGDLGLAEQHIRRSIELEPESAEAWTWLGDVLSAAGRAEQAKDAFERALRADGTFAPALVRLGILNEQELIGSGEALLRAALEVRPAYGLAYFALGDSLARQRRKGWEDTFRKGWTIVTEGTVEPPDPAEFLLRRGHLELAVEYGKRRLEQTDTAEHRARLAVALAELGVREQNALMLEEASRHARTAVEAEPNSSFALLALGRVLMSQGDLSGAREQLAKAAALEPEDADTLAFYGECLVRSGMVAEANKTLSRALSLKPMHAHANLWMANWHAAQGQRDAAVRYAQIARDSAARNYW